MITVFFERQLNALASILKTLPDEYRAEVADKFANAMAIDNPRFKRDLFMRASNAVPPEEARYRVNGSKRTYTLAQAETRRAKIFDRTGNVVAVEKVEG